MMLQKRIAIVLSLSLAYGCSEAGQKSALNELDDRLEDVSIVKTFRLDVYPPEDMVDEDGKSINALPQSFPDQNTDSPNLGNINLSSPILVSGILSGYNVTPWLDAEIPGTETTVEAQVSLALANTIQSYHVTTNENGYFSSHVVPGLDYTVSFVPEDPNVPFASQSASLQSSKTDLDISLGYGNPLWGLVTDKNGIPLEDVPIRAINDIGIASSTTLTDEQGQYSLRLNSGTYQLQALGRESAMGHDPVITIDEVEIDTVGAQVNIEYSNIALTPLGGGVVDEDGNPVDDVTVRFLSTSLDNYTDAAAVAFDVETNANGNFDTRLLPGTYEVELLPPADGQHTAKSMGEIEVGEQSKNIPTETLDSFVQWSGYMTLRGMDVPNARLHCTENGYANRHWSAIADDSGYFSIAVPQSSIECVATPPGSRVDLAVTDAKLNLSEDTELDLEFEDGVEVTGTLLLDGEPIQWAVLEVRGSNNQLYALALSDEEGTFTFRLTPK
ncbi:MAG: carboxypeptidase regulatory-like domain-containing protein [Proteobacteria bacterium]|nr:carboxypeptidase regulatory-like domain-containing protein [Pseudomonadota bacterium]